MFSIASGYKPAEVVAAIRRILVNRHGQEDFTITTQQQMLDVLGSVLDMLTVAVGRPGRHFAAGRQRRHLHHHDHRRARADRGDRPAAGSGRHPAPDSVVFSPGRHGAGGPWRYRGAVAGASIAWLIHALVPLLPVHTPWSFVVLAELLAMIIGIVAGILPARQAALLDPVEALRSE